MADDSGENIPSGWPPEGGKPIKVNFGSQSKDVKRLIVIGVIALFFVVLGVLMITGQGGLVEVSDTEVAVIVNFLTGEKELKTSPGYVIFIPWIQKAYKFDRSPNEFVMEGDQDRNWNHVSKLTVRANDGSNFHFEKLTIQYQINVDFAPLVLEDSGKGEGFKQNWVRAFSRSILRDEFGRYTAEEVTNPTNQELAKVAAKDRLNEALGPHGVDILEIITPKPKFNKAYEQAIEDRKQANQEVERLSAQLDQLGKEMSRKLAEVLRDKETAFRELQGVLAVQEIEAEKERLKLEQSAEAYKIEQANAGKATEQQKTLEAEGLTARARKEAEGLRSRVDALALKGDILVREALARKLAGITFSIVPYRRDPSPVRIEHMGATVAPVRKEEEGRQ